MSVEGEKRTYIFADNCRTTEEDKSGKVKTHTKYDELIKIKYLICTIVRLLLLLLLVSIFCFWIVNFLFCLPMSRRHWWSFDRAQHAGPMSMPTTAKAHLTQSRRRGATEHKTRRMMESKRVQCRQEMTQTLFIFPARFNNWETAIAYRRLKLVFLKLFLSSSASIPVVFDEIIKYSKKIYLWTLSNSSKCRMLLARQSVQDPLDPASMSGA